MGEDAIRLYAERGVGGSGKERKRSAAFSTDETTSAPAAVGPIPDHQLENGQGGRRAMGGGSRSHRNAVRWVTDPAFQRGTDDHPEMT